MPNPIIVDKIKQSVRMSVPLTVTTYKLPHETEEQIDEILAAYLEELGQGQLKDHLSYCLKELAVNAKKANTKRVYFDEKKLDIQSREDYVEGMKNFKEETLNNHDFWLEMQKNRGLYIKFLFHPKGRNFKISIKNNVEITRKEQMRVYDRIARSRAFETLEEAFAEVLDDSEGAGLGIVILVLMLRKMGLDEDAYEIEGEEGVTTASITVPINEVKLEKLDMLINQIVEEIDRLPQFPENIVAIQRLINDPKSEINDIARKISTDPSLTADLLKTVNSAQFMLPNKVDNIVDAVKMLGLRGVKNMLFNYGTEKILDLPAHPELWEHAHRVAFYSFTLARQITRSKDIIDDAYVGGVLHDIGKIVFSAVHPDLLDRIKHFSSERDIAPGLFEDLSAGYNHAEIGAKIAEKWNFSDSLIESIRYHHEPNACRPEHRLIVYCVYLGNAFCAFEFGEMAYDIMDHSILAKFRITSEEQFKEVQHRLSNNYDAEIKLK
ncbi:MAG: HDOD domain-containing protein [Spirochaetaceae bacterium]|nr:HDOD domain-containing protein [Spirochaetaceae bacterium]MDT8297305.1 HDOD domain-containing protein [Spirochaetaceae bacterium]